PPLELVGGTPQGAGHLRELLGSEQEQDHREDQQDLRQPQTLEQTHHRRRLSLSTRECMPFRLPWPGIIRGVLILSAQDVERLLDIDRLVDALADAMADLSAGRASMPARVAAQVQQEDGLLAVMPAHLPSAGTLGAKLVSVFPRNEDRGIPSHQAVIAAFDPATGTPVALMDGTYITAARTAAGSALATR